MGTHISRVKSVRLDNWKPGEVDDMKRSGNEAVNAVYLARLAPFKTFLSLPQLPEDGGFLREQWIRSKYERREYMANGPSSPVLWTLEQPVPLLEDWVVKRGAKRKSWKRRWLVVLGTSLAYFARKGDAQPKGFFSLRDVSAERIAS